MITITFNGTKKQVNRALTLKDFLQQEQYHLTYAAIAINRNFIPRSQYETTEIQDGDLIECVVPMQGG